MTSNPSRNLAKAACVFGVAGLLALAAPIGKAEAMPVNGDLLVAGTSANFVEQVQWGPGWGWRPGWRRGGCFWHRGRWVCRGRRFW